MDRQDGQGQSRTDPVGAEQSLERVSLELAGEPEERVGIFTYVVVDPHEDLVI